MVHSKPKLSLAHKHYWNKQCWSIDANGKMQSISGLSSLHQDFFRVWSTCIKSTSGNYNEVQCWISSASMWKWNSNVACCLQPLVVAVFFFFKSFARLSLLQFCEARDIISKFTVTEGLTLTSLYCFVHSVVIHSLGEIPSTRLPRIQTSEIGLNSQSSCRSC